MKLTHASGATQDGRVMVERSDRMWTTGEGNGKPLQYSCLKNPMNSMKRQKGMTLEDETPRFVKVLVAQSCLTFCNPVDYSLPGSSVHEILQARMVE